MRMILADMHTFYHPAYIDVECQQQVLHALGQVYLIMLLCNSLAVSLPC